MLRNSYTNLNLFRTYSHYNDITVAVFEIDSPGEHVWLTNGLTDSSVTAGVSCLVLLVCIIITKYIIHFIASILMTFMILINIG